MPLIEKIVEGLDRLISRLEASKLKILKRQLKVSVLSHKCMKFSLDISVNGGILLT